MSRFIRKCIVAASLSCVAATSQAELPSEQWWQWALGVPGAINPMLDETGNRASINNNGSVFFLAGNFGGTSTRTINVPAGVPLFFPVLNNVYVFTPPTSADDCFWATDWVKCGTDAIDMSGATDLHATLNGNPLSIGRETSTALFTLDLPEGNLFAATPGPYAAVSDGYWVAIAPPARGQYVLAFSGTNGDFSLQVTDTLNVPEPPTLAIALSALAALALFRRRQASAA